MLQTHLKLLVALFMTLATTSMPAQSPEAQLRSTLETQAAAWNRHDPVAWCAAFADDASFINVRGDFVRGRDAILKIHTFIFGGVYKDSHTNVAVDSVTFPAPTVAIVETTHTVTGFGPLPPGVVATEPGTLRTRMKYIFVQHGTAWQIVAAQNTGILPQPLGMPK